MVAWSEHTSADEDTVSLYPEHIGDFLDGGPAPAADRPVTPALAGLIEVENRLDELQTRLDYRYPMRPHSWHADELRLLHDALDELRAVVATIAGKVGAL